MDLMVKDKTQLDSRYPLSEDHISYFKENGFVKLPDVFSSEMLSVYGREISLKVRELNTMHLPMVERDTYQKAFLQVINLWRHSGIVEEFVFGKRLARIAAVLLEVDGVRMYHDQALYKEPGGGFTPWHADQYYWPLASEKVCTAWIPLQQTHLDMGPLEFSAKSHHYADGRNLKISDESEVMIQNMLKRQQFNTVQEPFEFGEISFHYGWTFHRAGPNTTSNPRNVMTIIYMDHRMRLKEPKNDNQILDRDTFCPGVRTGELIETELNPVLYHVNHDGASE